MPAKSKKQRRFFGLVEAIKKGKQLKKEYSKKAMDAAKRMSVKAVKHFSGTSEKGLPDKVRKKVKPPNAKKKKKKETPFSVFAAGRKIYERRREIDKIK